MSSKTVKERTRAATVRALDAMVTIRDMSPKLTDKERAEVVKALEDAHRETIERLTDTSTPGQAFEFSDGP